MKTLRPDQDEAILAVREAMRDTRRAVLQMPTGAGKTVIAADIVGRALAKGKRALITVPALSLVDQTVNALYSHGITDIGVIQAGHMMTNWSRSVQVASVQTLMRQPELPEHDVAIVDEVHRWFHFFKKWFTAEKWRKTPIIGLSATPWFEGLGSYFDKLIVGNTIEQMIAAKTLVPFRVYSASHPDLDGVRTRRDATGDKDYVASDLEECMNRPKLVGEIVESWKALAEDRPTVCFAVSRDHAAALAKQFEEAGVPSGYMDCDTPTVERAALRARFLGGDVRVVCNVDVVGLGVDWPEVSCIVYARPTRSEMRYVQNIGRGLRICEGKSDLIVIDHSDTTLRMGFVSDIHHEELKDGKPKVSGVEGCELPKECPQCHYVKPARAAVCSQCGFEAVHHAKPVLVERGTMRELKPADLLPKAMSADKRFPNRHKVYGELTWYQRQHGKTEKWVLANYKELYKVWPREQTMGQWRQFVAPPSPELASWLQSRRIAWAKGQGNRWGNGNGNGHANGHGADDQGTLGPRSQAVMDRVAEMTAQMEMMSR